MTIKKFKSGFTLVEIVVVIAIFGFLLLAASAILVSVIQTSNRTSVSNQVRESASRILEKMAADVRNAQCVSYGTPGELVIYDSACVNALKTYSVDATGVLTVTDETQPPGVTTTLSPADVAVCADSNSCPSTSCSPVGLSVANTADPDPTYPANTTKRAVVITLAVRQNVTSTRSDFCAKTVLEDTVTPRNAFN